MLMYSNGSEQNTPLCSRMDESQAECCVNKARYKIVNTI